MRLHTNAEKTFDHPLVGELTLRYERVAVAADPGLDMFVHVAEPGSRSAESFAFLASYPADVRTDR